MVRGGGLGGFGGGGGGHEAHEPVRSTDPISSVDVDVKKPVVFVQHQSPTQWGTHPPPGVLETPWTLHPKLVRERRPPLPGTNDGPPVLLGGGDGLGGGGFGGAGAFGAQ